MASFVKMVCWLLGIGDEDPSFHFADLDGACWATAAVREAAREGSLTQVFAG